MKKKKNKQRPELEQLKKELRRERYKSRYAAALGSTVNTLVVAAALAVLVATMWMPVLQIYGNSMTPSLHEGEIVLSLKTSEFSSGDIVGFYYGNKLLVKRCIAGPGDIVDIDREGNVYINDELLEEPYVSEKAFGECDISLPYQVPDEKWFLMGDHRGTSVDSRSTLVGCVAKEQLVGKIVFRVWPLNRFGKIE